MSLTTVDIIVLAAYGVLMAVFGVYFSKRNNDTEAYFVGGRSMSGCAPHLLPSSLAVPFDLYYTGVIGSLVMFAIGYLAGCLLPRREERSLDQLTVWTIRQRLDYSASPEVAR